MKIKNLLLLMCL